MAEVKSAPPPSKGRRVSHGAGGRRRFTSEGRERTPKKRHRRATSSVAAFHVFYGGDISDPLNLNSAHVDADDSQSGDDEPEEYVRKPVEDTPQTSEQPRHVEDPLRLLSDDKKEARRERKKHQRKVAAMKREEKRKQSTGDEQKDDTGGRRRKRSFSNDGESTDDGGRVVRKKKKKKKASTGPDSHMVDPNGLTFRPQDAKFAMGNYNRYYGYRNPTGQSDERLKSFPKAIFCDKACLDIGCNTGHVTLSIARDLNPASIIGVDVDRTLVETAEKNVRHYIVATESEKDMPVPAKRDFPLSFKLSYGPLASPLLRPPPKPVVGKGFPMNVSFTEENYVSGNVELACTTQKPEYDVILALSITKWIHLNWGDAGVKTLFHRAYHQLMPGGSLILEPQIWSSYAKKCKLTLRTWQQYRKIELLPEMFQDYLMKMVGFASMESLPTPKHEAKGFQRPLYLFSKSEKSDSYCNLCRPAPQRSEKRTVKKQVRVMETPKTEEPPRTSDGQ